FGTGPLMLEPAPHRIGDLLDQRLSRLDMIGSYPRYQVGPFVPGPVAYVLEGGEAAEQLEDVRRQPGAGIGIGGGRQNRAPRAALAKSGPRIARSIEPVKIARTESAIRCACRAWLLG